MTSPRRGAALLEVIVGLAILATSGTALVAAVGNTLERERAMLQREQELVAMERVLAATSLLTREELDQRLGDRRVGEFVVAVTRPSPELFTIGIRPVSRAEALLVTLVYRPETGTAP